MSLHIRPLNDTDYDEFLTHWWKDWNWTPPLRDFLPDDGKGGIMVLDDETPVCAGFMYLTNSKVAWIDWIISNKQYRKQPDRQNAIKLVIESLTEISKNTGAKYGYALIKNGSLIRVYEEFGYSRGDSYTSEMIKKL
jgi:hypothetical protein